jgi:hypothetical protein
VQISLRDLHQANGAARARARFLGPLRHPNRLLLDITLDEPVLLPPARRPVVTGLFSEPRPCVLVYALEEILAEKLRSILQRGKARDYYDIWRLLKEKADAVDLQAARQVLNAKCRHKGLPVPTVEAFLSPPLLEAASAFWSQDLIGQVPDQDLPSWNTVAADLACCWPACSPEQDTPIWQSLLYTEKAEVLSGSGETAGDIGAPDLGRTLTRHGAEFRPLTLT